MGSSCFWDDDCETENAQCKAVDPVVQSLFTPMACVCKTGYTAVGTDFCKPSESSRLFLKKNDPKINLKLNVFVQ